METITYLNLRIEGIPFTKLLQLEIKHKVNEHATARLSGEIAVEEAEEFLKRTDERTKVRILTTAAGQPPVLFCGIVENVGIERMSEYAILQLSLISTSKLSDIEKKNRSFQNTGRTHEEILRQVLAEKAFVDMQVTDRAIGSMLVQCNETDWEFCKRLASRLSAPVITSIYSKKPVLTVGLPGRGAVYNLAGTEVTMAAGKTAGADMLAEDRMGTQVHTTQYMFLGDTVSCGGGKQRVSGCFSTLESGMLVTTISIATEKGFAQQEITNVQISGKMYTGKVQAVEKDKVQVHLVDIDSSYEADGNVWLPYSTAYSSSDGSGFYCMPAVGDHVRVFFPAADEGQAFAASSVCVNPGAKVTDKQWTGPCGKQILLTEEGIFITTNANDNKIFINLTDESGITISSNKNITICAKNNLSLISNNSIAITAEKDILLSTAESYIDIGPKGISLGAENVVIK